MESCHLHLGPTAAALRAPATADLRAEHEVILRALTVLEGLADRLGSGQPVSDATLRELVELLQAFADRCHHGKEEDQLFPAMRAKGSGGTLPLFLEEHEEGRRYLRTLGSGAPAAERAAAGRRYVGLLRDHIERENEVLFPLADELFSPEEHVALARAYEDVERRVMGPGAHEHLLATLARLEVAAPPVGARS